MNVTPDDRRQLEAIIGDRNAPQKHVWRAQIILATADGCGTTEIMRRSGKAKPVVWRWQARFMAEGVAGLTRDKTRKPGKPPLPAAIVQRWLTWRCRRRREKQPIGPAGCWRRRRASACGRCSAFLRLTNSLPIASARSSCRMIRSSPQRLERRPVELFEQLPARHPEPADRPLLVEPIEQLADRRV